jgi:hypothetical protein
MPLLFNTDRALARIAANTRPSGSRPPEDSRHGRVWRAAELAWSPTPLQLGRRLSGDLPPDDERRGPLERAIEVACVGEPDRLGEALTADAEGWSPTLAFSTRAEAEEALRDQTSALTVTAFEVDRLCWSDPFVFAEWQLEAMQSEPLLIGDDVLIESHNRPIRLAGATVAELRFERISWVHTYFDDASLIEQVVVDAVQTHHY